MIKHYLVNPKERVIIFPDNVVSEILDVIVHNEQVVVITDNYPRPLLFLEKVRMKQITFYSFGDSLPDNSKKSRFIRSISFLGEVYTIYEDC